MDVFEAVNSRTACRWFLDKSVDQDVVRDLIKGAARAASNSNLQPWNVYAVTGEPLKEIKRRAAKAIQNDDWDTLETELPIFPENLWEPYFSRRFQMGSSITSSNNAFTTRAHGQDPFSQIRY